MGQIISRRTLTVCLYSVCSFSSQQLFVWCSTGFSAWTASVLRIYTSPIASIASSYDVQLAQYADDTQLYVALSKLNINITVQKLQSCLSVLHLWFSQNGLFINPENPKQFLFYNTASSCHNASFHVRWHRWFQCTTYRCCQNPGRYTLDSQLTFNKHVHNVCKSANYQIKALRHIWSSITTDMARTVACALVNTR